MSKPRVSAKARRRAAAARIADRLLTVGLMRGTRLAIVVSIPDDALLEGRGSEREIGGWAERGLVDLLEAELRPGQRRRADR